LALFFGLSLSAQAQIGTGWTPTTETYTIQMSAGCTAVPLPSGSGVGGVFNIPFSTPSTDNFRAEFRFQNLSTTTTEQFQGDVTLDSFGGDRVTVKQTFGAPPTPSSTSWSLIAVSRVTFGGFYDVHGGPQKFLAPFMVGQTARINTIFNPNGGASGAATVDVYINGTWVEQQTGGGSPSYNKVGAYASSTGAGPATVTWQNILFWTGGSANGGTPVVVGTPSFSPAAGTYGAAQTVTISSTTSGATIFYTTDGTTPGESGGTPTGTSTLYTGPITVSATTTNPLKAIAYESGQTDSSAATAAYTILTPAAAPTFSPGTGTYTIAQTVTISSATSGVSIAYTTDGSTPAEIGGTVTNGTLLANGGSVSIGGNTTLNAIAFGGGSADSTLATAIYTINISTQASAPTFSPVAGTYTTAQSVTLSSTNGTTIYYTTDGVTTPTTSSAVYSGPINLTQWIKLQAIAVASGLTNSPTATAIYAMNIPQVAVPTFSPAAGTYTAAQSVTINSTTLGATIRYTTDGSTTPSETVGTVYSGAITVGSTTSLKAIAYESGDTDSAIGTATDTIIPPAATPTFSPGAGTYTSAQSVTISDATSGATIYYTTNGSSPTTSSAAYSSPILVGSGTVTINAIGAASGMTNSTVGSATYTIAPPVATPSFSPAAATYVGTQSVTITSATSGVSIRYTTDGVTPPTETVGTLYSGPVPISATTTLKAIAYKGGYTDSIVTSGTYTILQLPSRAAVLATMSNVNNYWIQNNPTAGNINNYWDGAVYMIGDMDAYAATGNSNYLNYGLAWANTCNYALMGGNTTHDANDQAAGEVYVRLYQLSGSSSDLANITADVGGMVNSSSSGDWTWADALNMAMPVFAELGQINNNPASYAEMYSEFEYTKTALGGPGLYNPTLHLWARDATFLVPPATTAVYWSRGNAWVFVALAKVLATLPTNDPHYLEYLGTFQAMAAELLTLQQSDGFWYANLTDPSQYPTPETSGTAGFTYGLAWGINAGVLDPDTYLPAVINAWNGMATTAVQPSGFLGYVQGTGTQPSSSQPVTAASTADFGVGLFLEAGNQVAILVTVAAPTFSPAAGTYTSTQTVTITSATSGATIRYTTDGSTPTEINGTVYSGAVTIGGTTTLNAIAYKTGLSDSTASTAIYTIQIPATSTPTTASGAAPASSGGGGGAFDDWFLGFLAFAGLWRASTRANHKRQ
jgi:rhamnogalacturonyl hydrolase YesR